MDSCLMATVTRAAVCGLPLINVPPMEFACSATGGRKVATKGKWHVASGTGQGGLIYWTAGPTITARGTTGCGKEPDSCSVVRMANPGTMVGGCCYRAG